MSSRPPVATLGSSSGGKSSATYKCHMNDRWKWWKMSGADCCGWALALSHLDGCRSLLSVCLLLRPNEEKCKNQSMFLRKESAESLAGSPCWPLLKNEGKSKLIIILKACPGDAFCCDTSICQSFEDPPPPRQILPGIKAKPCQALLKESVRFIFIYLFSLRI